MSIIGIDFGTTLNKIGCFNPYGLRININGYKNPATPSAAFLNNKGHWFFGERAVKLGINNPKQCIYDIKLMLGHKFSDPIINKRREQWKFKTQSNENDEIKIVIKSNGKDQEFFPYEIAGLILNNLVEIANMNLPAKTSQVIISIPTKPDIKPALKKAAKLANIQIVRFIEEPISIFFAYMHNINLNINTNQNILIYDMGTSFIDASILEINNEFVNVTTERYADLNGQAFDNNIYKYALEKIKEGKIDIDSKVDFKLRIACNEAKTILSEVDDTEICIDDEDDEEKNIVIPLTRDQFDQINEKYDLFNRSMIPVKKVMEAAKVNKIDNIFLSGGSTYIKKIREKLKEITGKDPCLSTDPREAVALGGCVAGSKFKFDGILLNKTKSENINVKEIFAKKSVFYKDLEVFGKFNNPIIISFGSKEEIIAQQDLQIPSAVERIFHIDQELDEITFREKIKNEKQEIHKIELTESINGDVSISIQYKYDPEYPKILFKGTIGNNEFEFATSKTSTTQIYSEFIKQEEDKAKANLNKVYTKKQFEKEIQEIPVDLDQNNIEPSHPCTSNPINVYETSKGFYLQDFSKLYSSHLFPALSKSQKNLKNPNEQSDSSGKNARNLTTKNERSELCDNKDLSDQKHNSNNINAANSDAQQSNIDSNNPINQQTIINHKNPSDQNCHKEPEGIPNYFPATNYVSEVSSQIENHKTKLDPDQANQFTLQNNGSSAKPKPQEKGNKSYNSQSPHEWTTKNQNGLLDPQEQKKKNRNVHSNLQGQETKGNNIIPNQQEQKQNDRNVNQKLQQPNQQTQTIFPLGTQKRKPPDHSSPKPQAPYIKNSNSQLGQGKGQASNKSKIARGQYSNTSLNPALNAKNQKV